MIASSKQLGLGKNPFPCRNYIDNAVTWHAPTARALCDHITKISGKDWKIALGRHFVISEYTLYGLFVERICTDRSIFTETANSLCKTVWLAKEIPAGQLAEFCDALLPHQVALGFQSFVGVPVADLAVQLDRAIAIHAPKTH